MAQQVPHGLSAYYHWLQQYQKLLTEASKKPEPASYLFAQNCRTSAFMLQGLSRVYKHLHNKKRFTKMQENFKQDEDALGRIDLYTWLIASVKTNKAIAKSTKDYLAQQLAASLADANKLFKAKYFDSDAVLAKIQKKLDTARWSDDTQIAIDLKKFYKAEIAEINDLIKTNLPKFTQVEEHLHEIRRQLRWLSIYPQALNGVIQLSPASTVPAAYKLFITAAEKKSPFSKLPAKVKGASALILQRNEYFALSHIIAQLGILKDRGLLVHGIASAIAAAQKVSLAQALKDACVQLQASHNIDQEVLSNAHTLLSAYMKSKALLKL